MRILGVQGFTGSESHDASAALVVNGRVLFAAEEERFIREKHAKGRSPIHAAAECLRYAGIGLDDIDAIATGWNDGEDDIEPLQPAYRGSWLDTVLPASVFPSQRVPPVYFVKHHLAHIAAGFFLSGFSDALCVCVDGQGERVSSTVALGSQEGIVVLRSFPRRFSLGALYEAASFYCGLGYNVPGKLMGLAAFGGASYASPLTFDSVRECFVLDPAFTPSESADAFEVVSETERLLCRTAWPYALGRPGEAILYADVAASAQEWIRDGVSSLCRWGQTKTRKRSLVLTGGVALNCTINGGLERQGTFDNIFVPPGPNDASCSIGAALLLERSLNTSHEHPWRQLDTARLGACYDGDLIDYALNEAGMSSARLTPDELLSLVATDLASDALVAWFQGRSEFGPRALGGRSLLCSAGCREHHARVNTVKGREQWRPLAASVLADSYRDFFEDVPSSLSRFMLKAVPVRPSQHKMAPAIVHVDGTCRPHAVEESDGILFDLLVAYRERTGVPLLINTSLNGPGEPLVETPADAIRLYISTPGIDVLVLGDRYVRRG